MSTTPSADYSSISPSAKALLLMKGLTDIPYAKAAATLISMPSQYEPDYDKKDFTLWLRTLHFEARYRSINQLMEGLDTVNILELSSGFSFRGLVAAREKNVHYIDTDLPELIATKQSMIGALRGNDPLKGKLEVLPLNALDDDAFKETISHFSPGSLTIVNEGLLMYLGDEEKKQLCHTIREVLLARGGCWITADIYIKDRNIGFEMPANDKLGDFLKEHRVEEKKFDSFNEAYSFFKAQGLEVEKAAEEEYSKSGALQYLMKNATAEQLSTLSGGKGNRVQATWRLIPIK